MASATITTIHWSPEVSTATVSVSQRRILPQAHNGIGTIQPPFTLYLQVHRCYVFRYTGDIEAEWPYNRYDGTILELPRHVLGDPIVCANYLWNRLPLVRAFLDKTYVNLIAQKIGLRAYKVARSTKFSGFRLEAAVKVFYREALIVTTMVNGGASESTLKKLIAESFCANCGETGQCDNCVICLAELSGGQLLTRLPCSHVFHQLCVRRWLGRSNACPLCRSKVDED